MARIYLSLGSNIDREQHICAALDALSDAFGELEISTVFESVAVGFEGDSFYNLVVGIQADQSVGEITKILKHIEDCNGRDRSAPKFGPRSLDIDILIVDPKKDNFSQYNNVKIITPNLSELQKASKIEIKNDQVVDFDQLFWDPEKELISDKLI